MHQNNNISRCFIGKFSYYYANIIQFDLCSIIKVAFKWILIHSLINFNSKQSINSLKLLITHSFNYHDDLNCKLTKSLFLKAKSVSQLKCKPINHNFILLEGYLEMSEMPTEKEPNVNPKNPLMKKHKHHGQADENEQKSHSNSQMYLDSIPAQLQPESESLLQPKSQSQLPQSQSSSYHEKSKKNKKKNKKKNNKSKANEDISNKISNFQGQIQERRRKDREQYEAKKYEELHKAAKNCRNLKNLLGIKESINKSSQSSLLEKPRDQAKHPTFSLTPTEADFLNGKMPRGFSIQMLLKFDEEAGNLYTASEKPNKAAEHSPAKQKPMQQKTMTRFMSKKERKTPQSPFEQKKPSQQQPKEYWLSYHVIKEIITQMKQSDEIEDFFKYKFSDLCKRRAFRQYYKEYPQQIKQLLDLTTIEEMIESKELKTLLDVQQAIQDIYLHSFIIHHHLRNEYMLQATETFMRTFHAKYNSYTIENNFRKADPTKRNTEGSLGDSSETLVRTIPKTIKLKSGKGTEEYEEFLDMTSPDNKHRLQVMNYFLMRIFVNKEGNINALLARMTNLIQTHNQGRPLISRIHLSKFQKDCFQYYQVPYLNRSDNPLSLSLFHQLRTLLQAHIKLFNRMKKRNPEKAQESFNLNKQQELRNALYPRDQSDEFSIDDDDS